MFPGISLKKIAALESQPVTSGLFFFGMFAPKNDVQDYILQFGFQAAMHGLDPIPLKPRCFFPQCSS